MSVLTAIVSRTCVCAMTACALMMGCSAPVPSDRPVTQSPAAAVSFVNKVWNVQSSNAVSPGQLYVFLSEGTLVIASPNGKPALGRWRQDGGALTMIEEGIEYPVETLELTQGRFRVRMTNPGEPVEMTLVTAAQ